MNPSEKIRQNWLLLQARLNEVHATAIKFLGIWPHNQSAEITNPTGAVRVDNLAGQQVVMKWAYATTDGRERTMEVAIGHTGPELNPVLTFTGDECESLAIVLDDKDWRSFHLVRDAMCDCLKKVRSQFPPDKLR